MAIRYKKKMFNFTWYLENANQNYSEILPYTCQNGLLSTRQTMRTVGEIVEKKEPSFTAGGNLNWYNDYGKQSGDSLKN